MLIPRIPEEGLPAPTESPAIEIIPTSDGYIAAPIAVLASGPETVRGIMPDDWRFVSRGTVIIDEQSGRLSIDTADDLPSEPSTRLVFEKQPAVMRILKSLGDTALDGYLIDYRHVTSHCIEDRGLNEGVASAQYMEVQQLHDTQLPLGVLFQNLDNAQYIGHPDLAEEAAYLAKEVDQFASELFQQIKPRRAQL